MFYSGFFLDLPKFYNYVDFHISELLWAVDRKGRADTERERTGDVQRKGEEGAGLSK